MELIGKNPRLKLGHPKIKKKRRRRLKERKQNKIVIITIKNRNERVPHKY